MTSFERFKIEVEGIVNTIRSYSGASKISNFIEQLREAVNAGNKEKILYCLNRIQEWYSQTSAEIASNEFVSSSEHRGHAENRRLISEFIDLFEKEDESEFTSISPDVKGNAEPIIFISHKSDDKKYGHALRNFIIGLGVKNEALVYTSHPLHKIPLDMDIYDYLRQNISGNVFVIILWSDAYLDSPACLNEMGAAWVAQKDYTNIYVPTFSFGNPKYHQCAVDTRKMGAVLNGDAHCKASMIELKDKILEMFKLTVNEKQFQFLLDQFIKEITEG